MLGFSAAAFTPIRRPPQDSGEPRKVRQRKDATLRRFLEHFQGYLRNSRRILEIGSQAVKNSAGSESNGAHAARNS